MGRLTTFSRFLLTLAIVAGIFFGVRKFLPELTEKFGKKETTEATVGQDKTKEETQAPTTGTESPKNDLKTTAAGARPTFNYKPTPPLNGKLKGVVELGASGFNSFIINIDAQKDWKLEKAEYG
ncbi:MAG TPA: hypothetical protein V6C58_06380, partial [Allocoleopsis sp.]